MASTSLTGNVRSHEQAVGHHLTTMTMTVWQVEEKRLSNDDDIVWLVGVAKCVLRVS